MIERIIAVIGVVLVATGLAAQDLGKTWNFDADKAGNLSAGFTSEVGEWKVVADSTAPSKPNVLAQQAKKSGSTFNLVLVSGTNYKDVDISVKMKAVAGKEDQGGGLVWRAKDAKNYYVARYNPLEDSKYPPAKPGALRLLAPQRDLTAIGKEQESVSPMDRAGITLSPQVRIHDRSAYSRKCQTLRVPRQSRGFT